MQNIWKNLTQGLRDFCHANNFSDVLLGLSGGLDSALTAVLAVDALGKEHVHGIMLSTKNTSTLSLQIARKIAEMNGFDFKETDIDSQIAAETSFLSQLMEEAPKKLTLENLQARERGKILMAVSNQFNYLPLTCSNKSEICMGYCTLYGDTCGGLAPIGNLYKSDIFELAKWRNSQGRVLPEEVIIRAPSAELSPGQKDEDSLPPYKVLDKILRLHVDGHLSAAEICTEGFDAVMTEEIIRRYQSQEFKRRQLAPALRIK